MVLHGLIKRENCIFPSSAVLPEFNQLLDFFNLFDSRLILTLLLSLVINVFSYRLLGAWFRRKEVDSAAAVGLCWMHNHAPV